MTPKQDDQLTQMEAGRWYHHYEVRNGRTLRSLVKMGLIEYKEEPTLTIIGLQYTPWKYGKMFRKI